MKKTWSFIFAAGFSALAANAQDAAGKVNLLLFQNKIDEAKTEVDALLADPKANKKPSTYYLKGLVYSRAELVAKCATCRVEGFEAFKKYQEMDPKNTEMVGDNNRALWALYNDFFQEGLAGYNEKDNVKAHTGFKNALAVSNYLAAKKFEYDGQKRPLFDTALVGYVGGFAEQANLVMPAIEAYEQFAKNNVAREEDVNKYIYVFENYKKLGKTAEADAAFAKYRAAYPKDFTVLANELDALKGNDYQGRYKKAQEILAIVPDNYEVNYAYVANLFNYMYNGDTKPSDFAALVQPLQTAIDNTIKVKNTPQINFISARLKYNQLLNLQDEVATLTKSKLPADVKKVPAKKAELNKIADECIAVTETAVTVYTSAGDLKASEKNNLSSLYSNLESLYKFKGNAAKAAEAKAKAKL
jgi:tetratricopeptide (TPR) repeat protein